MTDMERCNAEIAGAEALLRQGHPDIQGLVRCIADQSAEIGLIEQERYDRMVRGLVGGD